MGARLAPSARLDWVGTSMSGLIGMLLAAKPGSPIRRLVMNDVGPFVPWNALIRLKGHVGTQSRFESLAEVGAYVRRVCASFGALDEAWWEHLARHGAEPLEGGGYRLRYDPDISRGLPVYRDPELPIGPEFLRGIDLWSIWKDVRCPVLVLRGADSEVLPTEVVAKMQRRKANVTVVEFAGVGHAPSLSGPGAGPCRSRLPARARRRTNQLRGPDHDPRRNEGGTRRDRIERRAQDETKR